MRPFGRPLDAGLVSVVVLLTLGVVGEGSRGARAKDPDPAERGLDVFVHAAPTAIAGDTLTLGKP